MKYYPEIYNLLFERGKKIESEKELGDKDKGLFLRDDQGDFWWELRDCDYYSQFELEKIVWMEISNLSNFSLDNKNNYLTNSAYMMVGKDLKYILGVLNSKVIDYYFPHISVQIAGQRRRYTKQYVEKIPVPLKSDLKEEISSLVDKILSITRRNNHLNNQKIQKEVNLLEKEIDKLVYKIYNLTPEEIKIVEKHI